MDRDPRLSAQLAPLESALMTAAQEAAAARVADAESQAAAVGRDSADRAHTVLERARSEGKAVAEREAAVRLMQAKRRARGFVLKAQRGAYDRLFAEADAEVRALRTHPAYGQLENRLVEAARSIIGPKAEVVRDPDGAGGVRAQAGSRVIDLTLPRLARRCIECLGERIAGLWS